jgi:aspartyl-tRNA(Asn)/glutamyl-tRNA(Gln) amidotransferase subunit A
LDTLGIAEASARIRTGDLSPVVLTQHVLQRIAELNPQYHAFVRITADDALVQAEQAETEIRAGRWRGPMHGVPFALKDNIDTAGYPTSCHSRLMPSDPVPRDATVTARLLDAGAVLIGKLALHEFAIGGPAFDLPWPPARNPWDLRRHPGGSSSGCGAALAAGLIPAAIGTDTGGSVRNPATCCGIVGMKPTYGRISRHGVFPLSFSLDHVGPMTRDVEDNAILFEALAGADPADPSSLALPAPDCIGTLRMGVKGLRIGVVDHFFTEDASADPEMIETLLEAVEILRDLGAEIRPVRLPRLGEWIECGRTIQQAEQYVVHQKWLRQQPEAYSRLGLAKLLPGAFVSAARYIEALQHRRRLCHNFAATMASHDALITLSGFALPVAIDDADAVAATYDKHARMPFNVAGVPSIAVPTRLSRSGLPLGMQIIGAALAEPMVYRVAHAYCVAAGSTMLRPPRPAAA